MKYRLKDLQIAGRYFGGDVIFDNKEEIRYTLIENLMTQSEENFSKLNLPEILEMMNYEIEEINKKKKGNKKG